MAEQGELLPQANLAAGVSSVQSLSELNAAKRAAWEHCGEAIAYLVKIMRDPDYDIDQRMNAAAELLQFAAKGPYF